MLVLSRKTAQQIQVGPHVTITILKVKGETVRIGIEAPKDVCVLRSEVAEKLAGQPSASDEAEATVRSALVSTERERVRAARSVAPHVKHERRTPRLEVTSRFSVGASSLHSHIAARSNRLAADLTPRLESTALAGSLMSAR